MKYRNIDKTNQNIDNYNEILQAPVAQLDRASAF